MGVNVFESPDPDPICCNRRCVAIPMVSSVDGLFGAGGAGTPAKLVVVLEEAVIVGRDEVVPVPDSELLHEASIIPPETIPKATSLIRRIVPLPVSLLETRRDLVGYLEH